MYTIIREKEFDEQISLLSQDYSRMTDLEGAIDWALGINPLKIPNIVQVVKDFWLWTTDEFFNMDIPTVRILYHVDVEKMIVRLFTIEEIKTQDEPVFLEI